MNVLTALAGRLWRPLHLLISRYMISAAERAFVRTVDGSSGRSEGGAPVVLIEAVEDYFYLSLFANVVEGISAERPIRVEQFVPRSLRPGSSRSPYQALKSLLFYNSLTDRKWIRLYSSFCGGVAYRSASALVSRAAITDLIDAWRIAANLSSKESLLDLTMSGIKVGDLIYDSYLRFKPAATIDLNSLYLWIVIWQTLRDLRAAHAYMMCVKPRIFLTTYSTYIQHGIAARVALAAGVKVFTFGNFQELYKQLDQSDWVHTRNPDDYRSQFSRLGNSEQMLAAAESALTARMAGGKDVATAYMRRSAYDGSAALPAGVSGSLVIFLHDFFDSPHCYQWMIFPDFWDWATFTLDVARRAGIRVYVKPHPNQIADSRSVVRKLKAAYPEANWLSTLTSNLQLVEAGIACAVTVYGTVAHEMAYLGIPTIAAGHNPHIAFSICHTAHTREEYSRLIVRYRELAGSPEKLRRESLEFYCMHNLACSAEESSLRTAVIQFRTLVSDYTWLKNGPEFLSMVKRVSEEPGFHTACKALAAQIDSGPQSLVRESNTNFRERVEAL